MLTYEEIKPHIDAGKTVAEIVAIYAGLHGTVRNMNANELQTALARAGWFMENIETRAWEGRLWEAVKATEAGLEDHEKVLTNGMVLLANQFENQVETIATTDHVFGALLAGIMQVAVGAGLPDIAGMQAKLDELSGGRLYAGVDEAFISQLIVTGEDQVRIDGIEGWKSHIELAFIQPAKADGSTLSQLKAQIKAHIEANP